MKKIILFSLLAFPAVGLAGQLIPANDARIEIRGTKYIIPSETGLQFLRHSEATLSTPRKALGINPDKARNNSGIVLAFETDSPTITVHFNLLTANYMGSRFGVFENGVLIADEKHTPKIKTVELDFNSHQDGKSIFEITLPSFASVEFTGIEIAEDASIARASTAPTKTYVALGDSISHGVGQDGSTHLTWPFLLSQQLDTELFNLAVGGGKISVPIAKMLSDWEHIDLITILIGYNDLHFDGKTPQEYHNQYTALLDAIRVNHPQTRIVCISPLFTKKPVSEKTGATVDQFRAELERLVQSRQAAGDELLHLIQGETVSDEQSLRLDHPQDPVHLGIDGAARLADEIFTITGSL